MAELIYNPSRSNYFRFYVVGSQGLLSGHRVFVTVITQGKIINVSHCHRFIAAAADEKLQRSSGS